MSHKPLSPKLVSNFLDTCAFDPKFMPEDKAAEKIRTLGEKGVVKLVIARSNQIEIEHPNTPLAVQKAAASLIFTLETDLNQKEVERKADIHLVMTGNGNPDKYAADAAHIFEAGKYGGYFITTDERILKKREELEKISGARIFKPTEWLRLL